MEIKQEQRGKVQLLSPVGRLDTDSASDLELALQDAIAAGSQHFVIDLAEIGYVSSAGLRVLSSLVKQLEGSKGSLRLAGRRNHKPKQSGGCRDRPSSHVVVPPNDRDAARASGRI